MAGFAQSHMIARLARAERRPEFRCPHCGASPPFGDFWRCSRCLQWFDVFAPATSCPKGGDHITPEICPDCGRSLDPQDWRPATAAHVDDMPI
jgi:hypothetical protein